MEELKTFRHEGHDFKVTGKMQQILREDTTWRLGQFQREQKSGARVHLGRTYLHGVTCLCRDFCMYNQITVRVEDLEDFVKKLG